MRAIRFGLAFVVGGLVAGPASAESVPSIFGAWIEPVMQAVVEVFPCGEAICGTLIQLPDDAPNLDVNNPDPALRDRPLLGLRVLEDFRPAGEDGVWVGGGKQGREPGRLYVPANGDTLGDAVNTYEIRLTSRDTLSVGIHGCVFSCLLNSIWTRAE